MRVKLMENGIFSTAAKLFVWCLRPRAQKAQSSRCWHWVGQA